MIVFDPGVLMGSKCQSVFDEYVEMHPGAVNLRKAHNAECKCGRPECFRRWLQERVLPYVDEDKDRFCNLLNTLADKDGVEETNRALYEFLGLSRRKMSPLMEFLTRQ